MDKQAAVVLITVEDQTAPNFRGIVVMPESSPTDLSQFGENCQFREWAKTSRWAITGDSPRSKSDAIGVLT